MRPLAVAGALALAGGALIAAAQTEPAAPQPPRPSWHEPAGDAGRGEQLAQPCLVCHVENPAMADPVAPKLHHQRQSYIFFALLEYRDGQRSSDIMEPFAANLTDQDARDLAAYLGGAMLDRPPPARDDLPGHSRSIRECTWCHGETGIGEYEGMPVLTGQEAAYLATALSEYRDGRRTDPTMSAVARELDPEFDRELAEYYAAHEWLEHGP